jgi:ABC-type phosphate/phosphonate transport system substrate-binding protein
MPMYDFPEIREHTDALWTAVAQRARSHGIDAPDYLIRPDIPLEQHWVDPAILLSHTCGYPVMRVLTENQHVLGSFAVRSGDPDQPGWYRTVVVCRAIDHRADAGVGAFDGAIVAANDEGSLSGYVSFGVALAEAKAVPSRLVLTGAHERSVAAVLQGSADLASIDAHSFSLLVAHRPAAVMGLRVIGCGPQVAVTPLFTAQRDAVDPLRAAVAQAVATLPATTRDALQLVGFVPHGKEAHEAVSELAERATVVWKDVPRERTPLIERL